MTAAFADPIAVVAHRAMLHPPAAVAITYDG